MQVNSTPLRSFLHKKQKRGSKSIDVSPIVQEDEDERRKRRSHAGIRHLSTAAAGSPSLNSSRPVDVDEFKDHFKLCQKLFAENKINTKNVWNLKLIDYLKVLMSQDIFEKNTMLLAATSLDICSKVYACRVDDAYDKGIKLAGTISSLESGKVVHDAGDDDANEQNNDKAGPKKKKKRRLSVSQKCTIAKDRESLVLPDLPKLPTTFFTGHMDVNASNTEKLFTNKLPLDHVGHKSVLLDKANRAMLLYDAIDYALEYKNTEALPPYRLREFKICPLFSTFHIDEWDPEHEEAQFNSFNKSIERAAEDIMQEELVYDEQGMPVAELDGSIHDIFAEPIANDSDGEHDDNEEVNTQVTKQAERIMHREEFIVSFCPSNRGSTANKELDPWWVKRIQVGPSHWKNKFLKQRRSRFTGRVENNALNPKVRRKAKLALDSFEIDFNCRPEPFDFTKLYKSSRKCQFSAEKYTLPRLHTAMFSPGFLMSMPILPEREYQAEPKDGAEEYEHSPYDYDNPNDSQYCSQNSVLEGADDNVDEVLEEIIEHCQQDTENMNVGPDNLVEAPEMVPQTYIPYALRAKKINMKRLKSIMWEVLTEDKNCKTIVNLEDKPARDMKFSVLYNSVNLRLPENMSKELTPHLAFVSLLHLTNENNLRITQQKDLRDLRVQQDRKD